MVEADLIARVRLDLLSNALRERAGGSDRATQKGRLDRFVKTFRAKCEAQTACAEG